MIFDFFQKKKPQTSSAAPNAGDNAAKTGPKEPDVPVSAEFPTAQKAPGPVKDAASAATNDTAQASAAINDTAQASAAINGTAQAFEPAGSEDPFFEALRKGNIDPREGLKYSQNNEELYRILLEEYINSAGERTAKMKSFIDEGDIKNYTIQAHSLKSTSKTIGAIELSDRALKLEKAADSGDWDTVVRENAELLSDYELVVRAAKAALEN